MRFEQAGNRLHLYFTHTSGRNFVISEDIEDSMEKAKTKLMQRMGEMNAQHTSE